MIRAFRREIANLLRTPLLVVPFILICFPLFYALGGHCIYMWDEAIYANNAIEMLHSGNWFVIQNNGIPSHYNVKPPLVIWMQAVSMGIFGVSEWALRLPSALAGLGIALITWVFSRRWLGTYLPGIFASMMLVSAYGFVRVHMVRTGDLDAVLLFFTTAYTFLLVDYLLMKTTPGKYVLPVSVLVFLGFLSKSLGALLPLVPLLFIFLSFRKGRGFLVQRRVGIAIFSVFCLIMLYYFARDVAQPGYFRLVWESEFLRLTHNVMPWHEHPFTYYIVNFVKLGFFSPHIFFLPVAIALLLIRQDQFIRKVAGILTAFCLLFLLFISIPVVKLEWYDAPVYPFASMLLGIAIWKYARKWYLWLLVLLLILVFPYRSVLTFYRSHTYPSEPLEREGHFMRDLTEIRPEIKKYDVFMQVLTPEHLDQMHWYQKKLNWFEGHSVAHVDSLDKIRPGYPVLCCQETGKKDLEGNFSYRVLEENQDCRLYLILRK